MAGAENQQRHVRGVIVGSGVAGPGAAVKLQESGYTDFLVIERGNDVGGTWRDNTYPGAACDVPSQLYSYSFATREDWTRSYSPQDEIQAYLRRVGDWADVRSNIVFNCELTSAQWDAEPARWQIVTTQGEYSADILVTAFGALS